MKDEKVNAKPARKTNDFIYFAKGFAIAWIIIYHVYELLVVAFGTGQHSFRGNLPLEIYNHFIGDPLGLAIGFFATYGYIGVSIFIVMSGFLLYWAYGNREIKYWEYVKKRFIRAFPLYWGILIFFVITSSLYFRAWQVTLPQLLLDLVGLQSILGINAFSINPSFWFMGLYMQLLLISPFLVAAFRKYNKEAILAISFIISGAFISLPYFVKIGHPYFITALLPCRLFEYVLGMYLAFRYDRLVAMLSRAAAIPASIAFVAFGFFLTSTRYTYPVSTGLLSCSICLLLLTIYLRIEKSRIAWPALWFFFQYGVYSYAAFLINQPNIAFYFRALAALGIKYLPLQMAIYLCAILFASAIITRLYEVLMKKLSL